MSYRDLPRTLAAIEGAFTEPPSQPWTDAYALCARPRCINLTLRWLSPYCTPDCARSVAAWLRDPHRAEFPAVELTADEQALRDRLTDLARLCRTQHAEVREADELQPDTLDEQDLAVLHQVRANWPATGPFIDGLPTEQQHELAQQLRPVITPEAAARLRARLDGIRGMTLQRSYVDEAFPERQGLDALRYAIDAVQRREARPADDPMLTGRWEDAAAHPFNAPTMTAEQAADALGLPLPPRPEAKPRPRPRPPWWRRLANALSTRKARP